MDIKYDDPIDGSLCESIPFINAESQQPPPVSNQR